MSYRWVLSGCWFRLDLTDLLDSLIRISSWLCLWLCLWLLLLWVLSCLTFLMIPRGSLCRLCYRLLLILISMIFFMMLCHCLIGFLLRNLGSICIFCSLLKLILNKMLLVASWLFRVGLDWLGLNRLSWDRWSIGRLLNGENLIGLRVSLLVGLVLHVIVRRLVRTLIICG
jgi:hypothetical protein